MTSGLGEHFPRCARLRRRSNYLDVQRNGRKVDGRAFMCIVLEKAEGPTRLGITTPKRLGCAVLRNRARRLVRESFRHKWMRLPEHVDAVVIAKKKAVELDSEAVFLELAAFGDKVRKLVEQDY
jgi:ribonuclease P protein component